MKSLTIATCQFPIDADIRSNERYMLRQISEAKAGGAAIAHFAESSLSGYAGIEFKVYSDARERQLHGALSNIRAHCVATGIWAIIGGHQFEKKGKKPFNCLWVIDNQGKIAKRYDKRFLYGDPGKKEHFYYHPGKQLVQFNIKGITCGLLICHEWRYPELYREQLKMGTDLLFQSWYDGGMSSSEYETEGRDLGSLITGTVRGNAANNRLWISGSNTCKKESCFPAFVIRPDGKFAAKLKRNVSGVLITTIDFSTKFEDPSAHWRHRAMDGILYSG